MQGCESVGETVNEVGDEEWESKGYSSCGASESREILILWCFCEAMDPHLVVPVRVKRYSSCGAFERQWILILWCL
ncbi:snRNA-activating protein complex subunit 4 [Plakobranchus ocellatus]|uniref:snRNA-activating protein complex subunit 4 n=1 Tax=Plakobranchus ocellatus TaxID=259542 RepID=A0AAV3Y679_9GAST|nr:snRNA-activating protein complex subunit 4 [Plakobranchus ocellatus]